MIFANGTIIAKAYSISKLLIEDYTRPCFVCGVADM